MDDATFQAMIAAHRGDPGPLLVYADWLEEQGESSDWQRQLAAWGGGFASLDEPITVEGFTLSARIERDSDMGEPWLEHDGHGPVSLWTHYPKRAGERILCEDGGRKRYYDFEAAVKLALKDGWDAPPYGTGTKGQQAARAAEADFERLRRWCNDHWWWCGVVLTVASADEDLGILDEHAASLWGIESDAGDYLIDVANELISEALKHGREMLPDDPPAEPPTRVVFRKWRRNRIAGDGIIALFPELPATVGGYDCSSYEHVGQHGAADYHLVIQNTRPATVEEAAELSAELTRRGYNLKVIQRVSQDIHQRRHAAARATIRADPT